MWIPYLTLTGVVYEVQAVLAFAAVVTRYVFTNTEFSGTAEQVLIQAFIDVYTKTKKY